MDHSSTCAVAAASRDQAMVLFEQMRGFVQRSPKLRKYHVMRGYREIRFGESSKNFTGLVKVYAADADPVVHRTQRMVTYGRDEAVTAALSRWCDLRVI